MALSATANAELKVATVDVQKLFADYYKTHEAQAEVDKAAQTVQETNNTRAETIKKMEADFNAMVKRLQDPMLNEKDKKELEQKAQIKRQEVIALEQERRGFVERQLKSLQEQMKVRSAKIMGEITKSRKASPPRATMTSFWTKAPRPFGPTRYSSTRSPAWTLLPQ